MKQLLLITLLMASVQLYGQRVVHYPVTGVYVAKVDTFYLKTYESSPAVLKCYGFAAANHYPSREGAQKLLDMYIEQKIKRVKRKK